MKSRLLSCVALLGLLAFTSAPANAVPRTFVSKSGSGATCSRAAPCADFQTAHNATDPGGEINCLDSGNFSTGTTFNITKSITVDCGGTSSTAAITAATGIQINGPNITVRLRNLTIVGTNPSVTVGISFLNGDALFIEKCVIANFASGSPSAISFAPLSGITAKLFVSESLVSNASNAGNTAGSGIDIIATAGVTAQAMLDRVRVENNRVGINVVKEPSAGLAAVQIRNSVVGNNAQGITVQAITATASVTVDRSSALLNSQLGLSATGASAFLIVGKSTVMSNGTSQVVSGGGSIISYSDNQLTGNAVEAAPTGTITPK